MTTTLEGEHLVELRAADGATLAVVPVVIRDDGFTAMVPGALMHKAVAIRFFDGLEQFVHRLVVKLQEDTTPLAGTPGGTGVGEADRLAPQQMGQSRRFDSRPAPST